MMNANVKVRLLGLLLAVCPPVFALDIQLEEYQVAHLEGLTSLKVGVHSTYRMPYWNGNVALPHGISHDVALLIGDALNVPIEYIQYESISDVVDAVASGGVDFAVGYGKDSLRVQELDFSKTLYQASRVAWIRQEAVSDDIKTIRWGCIVGTTHCQYLYENGYKNVTEYNNHDDFYDALIKKEIDAVSDAYDTGIAYFTDNLIDDAKIKLQKDFGKINLGAVFSKDNKTLLSIMNKVIERSSFRNEIDSIIEGYHLNNDVYQRLFHQSNEPINIRYTVKENLYPFSFYNQETEQYEGYVHNLLNKISVRAPINFEYVPPENRNLEMMLSSGLTDLLPMFNYTAVDEFRFAATRAYGKITYKKIKSRINPTGNVTGILDRSDSFRMNLTGTSHILYTSMDELIEDIKSGKVTYAYVYDYLLESIMLSDTRLPFDVVSSFHTPGHVFDLVMLLDKDNHDQLEWIDAALATFTEQELANIWLKFDRLDYQWGLDKRQVLSYSFFVAVLLVFIAIGIYFSFRKLKSNLEKYYISLAISQIKIKWLNQIIDAVPDLICIRDDRNNVILANKRYKELSHQVGFKGHAELSDHLSRKFQYSMRDELSVSFDIIKKNRPLSVRHFDATNKHIRDGEKNFIMTILHDSTDAKRKEQGLIESNNVANALIEQKKQFFAVVSHELRTPISAMVGLIEILNSGYDKADKGLVLSNAFDSANRLKQLVDDILDYSKLDNGQMAIALEPCNLITELCPIFRPFELVAEKKGIKFHFSWKASPYILADIDILRVNQIITNILSNSVKFTSNGGVFVNVSTSQNTLRIVVRDTGIGMSKQQLDTLFVPFVQADVAIARQFGGTGLGMSIVSSLLTLMQGSIKVDSTLNLGTLVEVMIPIQGITCHKNVHFSEAFAEFSVCKSSDPDLRAWCEVLEMNCDTVSISSAPYHNFYPDSLDLFTQCQPVLNREHDFGQKSLTGHVLVVDDEAINRFLMLKQLEQLGLTGVAVENGREALEELARSDSAYDVLMTDYHMPDLNGLDVAKRIRSHKRYQQNLPILFCTADNSESTVTKVRQIERSAMLCKPYQQEELYDILAPWLDQNAIEPHSRLPWYSDGASPYVKEMAEVIIDSFSGAIDELSKPGVNVKTLAHRLKGSGGMLKNGQLVELCKRIEVNPSDDRLVDQLCAELRIIIDESNRYLESLEE